MPRPDISTPARRTAVLIEDAIRHDSLETGALISSKGSTLVTRQGMPNRVTFTEAELRRERGATFTHNHPANTGPSIEDVELCAEYGMAELRVVTPTHRYIIARRSPLSVSAVRAAYVFQLQRTIEAVRGDVRAGSVNRHDFGREVVHRIWGRISGSLGFVYGREQ